MFFLSLFVHLSHKKPTFTTILKKQTKKQIDQQLQWIFSVSRTHRVCVLLTTDVIVFLSCASIYLFVRHIRSWSLLTLWPNITLIIRTAHHVHICAKAPSLWLRCVSFLRYCVVKILFKDCSTVQHVSALTVSSSYNLSDRRQTACYVLLKISFCKNLKALSGLCVFFPLSSLFLS